MRKIRSNFAKTTSYVKLGKNRANLHKTGAKFPTLRKNVANFAKLGKKWKKILKLMYENYLFKSEKNPRKYEKIE